MGRQHVFVGPHTGRELQNGRHDPTPLLRASGFDGDAQEPRERSATLERAFAHVERADLGPGCSAERLWFPSRV
jgi:hypothetical protein